MEAVEDHGIFVTMIEDGAAVAAESRVAVGEAVGMNNLEVEAVSEVEEKSIVEAAEVATEFLLVLAGQLVEWIE